MRVGKHPMRMPFNESDLPKIILLDLRPLNDFNKWHIKNALSFPSVNIQKDHIFGSLN